MILNLQNRFEIIEKICRGSSKAGTCFGFGFGVSDVRRAP